MGAAVMRAFIHPDDTSVPRGEPHSSTVFYPDGSFELRANQHVVDRLQTDPRHTSRVAYLYGLRADSFQPAPAGPCYPEETADQQLMWISHKPVEPTVIALLGRRVFDLGSIEALPPSDLLATYSDPAA
ncbi:MAG TPA: hypothetical protein VMY99_02710 [Nevskiaceae bacterium]|nr:hypothetical protein [Nevskiaceae bacterium]